VALSALYWSAIEANRREDMETLEKIVCEMESYPPELLKNYSFQIEGIKRKLRMERTH
jgi:hypothetical protein